jgi:prolyl 4-hydroxylase
MLEGEPHLADQQRPVPSLGLGFVKTALDPHLHEQLLAHLRSSIHSFKSEPDNGFVCSQNPRSYPSLVYHDNAVNQWLMEQLLPAHEAWSGRPLRKAACFGIRVYQPGSYLLSHNDRARTHVVSSTICVDHRLRNPWPLHIEDLQGKTHEVSIEPGEMVFFEGARLKHGRPQPLEGDYYASIFVHYTPLDWDPYATDPDH